MNTDEPKEKAETLTTEMLKFNRSEGPAFLDLSPPECRNIPVNEDGKRRTFEFEEKQRPVERAECGFIIREGQNGPNAQDIKQQKSNERHREPDERATVCKAGGLLKACLWRPLLSHERTITE